MRNAFRDYYQCADEFGDFGLTGPLMNPAGYFTFRGATCYGRIAGNANPRKTAAIPDVSGQVQANGSRASLPFDLTEVVTNLREERYDASLQTAMNRVTASGPSRQIYYFLRPILPVPVRKHLQRIHLNGWDKIGFPQWPVDLTVEALMQSAMNLALGQQSESSIPFIWFWPDGARAAAIVTHDVEGERGLRFCTELMDIDDSFDIKSSFQIVPESRYQRSDGFFGHLRHRGFEVNVHDLKHDGNLFYDKPALLERAIHINRYAREFESRGFRSAGMYRDQAWLDVLDISFDMSVPNAAHLEPQRGGCCTVMPYFVGDILELPLTTTQDYSLFHILNDYSTALWRKQIELILGQHGLITILTHPDYLVEQRARAVYRELLEYVAQLRDEKNVWVALAGEVDTWWRARRDMRLVQRGGKWHIEGPQSDRARIAYATRGPEGIGYTVS